jgi:hypothetical protein
MELSDDGSEHESGDISGAPANAHVCVDVILCVCVCPLSIFLRFCNTFFVRSPSSFFFAGDEGASSLSDGSDVAEPSFQPQAPARLLPQPSLSLSSMAPKAVVNSVATLGIPSALDSGVGNTWIEAVEADALQVRSSCMDCFWFDLVYSLNMQL